MHKRQTLLVVDDDVLVRIALAEYLRACGCRVIESASLLEAKTVLQDGPEISPEISVVLACAQLAGGEGGFGLEQWARRYRPQARVILSGSLAKKVEVAESLCSGAGPCPGEALLQRIQSARAKRRNPKLAGEARGFRSKSLILK